MGFKQFILIIFAISIVLSGCATDNAKMIMSEELIIANLNDVDSLQVSFAKQESKQTTNKEIISDMLNSLSGIKMEKIDAEKEIHLVKNTKIFYTISVISGEKLVGSVMVFSTGDILMPDIMTMNSNQRTESYIHYKLDKKRLQDIVSAIERLK